MSNIFLTGTSTSTHAASRLTTLIAANAPRAIGMATAFLSTKGASTYDRLFTDSGAAVSRVVVGLSGEVTHPQAIQYLTDRGHGIRFGTFPGGIFHPKLLIGGDSFLASGQVDSPKCGYVGSANFTGAGLFKNLEVMLATNDAGLVAGISTAFSTIWGDAQPVTDALVQNYERAFARSQRRRSLADLAFLDVVDSETTATPARQPTLVLPHLCSAVWAGLQSYTGEHAFQVEFPRRAGEAMQVLLRTQSGEVPIECSDGEVRSMKYRYYTDNGMYRLNVPNAMPLVDWARRNRQGALLVWRDDSSTNATLNAEIIRGRRLSESVSRSYALGSWGRTSTREYGWY